MIKWCPQILSKLDLERLKLLFSTHFACVLSGNLQNLSRKIPYFRFKSVRKCVFAYMVATPLVLLLQNYTQKCYHRSEFEVPYIALKWFTGADLGFLERGVLMYKSVGVPFADFISFFSNIPWKWNNLISLRPNYFIFIGYLNLGGMDGGSSKPPEPPLDPPLIPYGCLKFDIFLPKI